MSAQERRLLYLERMGIEAWVPRRPQLQVAESQAPAPDLTEPALDWGGLEQAVAACRRCGLREGCSETVFGVGDPRASLLVVVGAPQAEEGSGKLVSGPAGGLLDNMLRAIGLTREATFVTSALKCALAAEREPQAEQFAACAPYLTRQIELIQPRAVLALGRVAARALQHGDQGPGSAAGAQLVTSHHPADLLRSPAAKAQAWQDLKTVRGLL